MDVRPAFVADRKPPKAVEPREASLYYPAVTAESLATLYAPAGYARTDPPATQEPPAARVVVTFVGM